MWPLVAGARRPHADLAANRINLHDEIPMLRHGREFVLVTLAVLAVVVSAPVRSPGQGGERVIRFWHPYTQPQRAKEMQRAADEFEAANPGIKVEVEIVPWANINARWRAASRERAAGRRRGESTRLCGHVAERRDPPGG